MVAGGANVVVLPRVVEVVLDVNPSIKVATNTPMYERMIDDMDINAGTVLTGKTVQELGRDIYEEIIEVASGKSQK